MVTHYLLLLLEHTPVSCGIAVDTSLLEVTEEGRACTILSNPTGSSMNAEGGSELGTASPVDVVDPQLLIGPQTKSGSSAKSRLLDSPVVLCVHSKPDGWRKEKLNKCIGPCDTLVDFLGNHPTAFALEDHGRGDTSLVEFSIETWDAEPHRCAPRRMPFAVTEEVARQLKKIQEAGIIQPSSSPWASPVVM